jgi:hypothetical protein
LVKGERILAEQAQEADRLSLAAAEYSVTVKEWCERIPPSREDPGRILQRWVFLLGVGIMLVAGAFLLTDQLLCQPGVTEANVRRIRQGMAVREVEVLLGGPGQDIGPWGFVFRRAGGGVEVLLSRPGPDIGWPHVLVWVQPRGHPVVHFCEGRVERAAWIPDGEIPPSFFERVRSWFDWLSPPER